MSSNFEKLIETITDLVLSELANGQPSAPDRTSKPQFSTPVEKKLDRQGAKVLVAPGPSRVDARLWAVFSEKESPRASALVWNGFRQDQLPTLCADWALEARSTNWTEVVSGYKAIVLLGSDLATLGALANLGYGGCPPASVAVAGLSSGLPVFVEHQVFENLRRHSSRLSSGFVRRFEELYRIASSFGVEFGGASSLSSFLQQHSSQGRASVVSESRSGGRDVVTVEDVDAVRQAGQSQISVTIGTIVTPLAAQRALEWGIEVKFQ